MSRAACVMQPRLLPHLGYFALMSRVDTFVLFDSAQYPRREWVNRNRVRSGGELGWRWIRVPVRHADRNASIREIEIAYEPPWQERLRRSLDRTYASAPHRREVGLLLDPLWARPRRLVDLIVELLQRFAAHLGLAPEWEWASRLEDVGAARREAPSRAQSRVLHLCREVGASVYWNLPGGRRLYDPRVFAASGIELRFVPETPVGDLRRRYGEASSLSILDLAMYHSAAELRAMIELIFATETRTEEAALGSE